MSKTSQTSWYGVVDTVSVLLVGNRMYLRGWRKLVIGKWDRHNENAMLLVVCCCEATES